MSNNVKIANSVIPSKVDTPLDARSRVVSEADILNIENPAIGQLVYCINNGKFYVVTGLKAKQIGAITVQNAAVDTYEELSAGGGGGEISEEQKEELLNELEDRLLNGEWGTV
jgi:hypothetical protein